MLLFWRVENKTTVIAYAELIGFGKDNVGNNAIAVMGDDEMVLEWICFGWVGWSKSVRSHVQYFCAGICTG